MSFDFEDDLDADFGLGVPTEPAPVQLKLEVEQVQDLNQHLSEYHGDGQQQDVDQGTDQQGQGLNNEPSPSSGGDGPEQTTSARHGVKRPLEVSNGDDDSREQPAENGNSAEPSRQGSGAAADNALDDEEMASLLQEARQSNGAVYLANLAWWTTDAEVESACSEFGRVLNMKFIEDRYNGKSKGCVLVEYGQPQHAVACKEQLQGRVINGKPVMVTFAGKGAGAAMAASMQQQQQQRGQARHDGGSMQRGGMQGGQQGGWGGRGRGVGNQRGFAGGFPPLGMPPGMGAMPLGPMAMAGLGLPGMGLPGMGMGMGLPGMPGMGDMGMGMM